MADLMSGAAGWLQPMQLVPTAAPLPTATALPTVATAVPTGAPAQPASAQPQLLSEPQPQASYAQPSTLSRIEQLVMADATIADVQAIAANGERLVEALADAAGSKPQELQQQVAALLQATAPLLQHAEQAWAQLQHPPQQPGNGVGGAAEAAQVSLALGALQQQAAQLASPDTAPGAVAPDLDRQSQAEALEQLVGRVASITGHHVQLMATTAGTGMGLPGKLRTCNAAEATQVHMCDAMVACMALASAGSLEPVRLAVFSVEEHKAGGADAWAHSQHHVYQRVSAWGMQALGHFQQRAQLPALHASVVAADQQQLALAIAGAPLEDQLLWLATYDDLFTRPCDVTGTLLAADAASLHCFPPLIRPFRLGRQQLLAAAQQGGGDGSRKAYHPHAAPQTVLRPA